MSWDSARRELAAAASAAAGFPVEPYPPDSAAVPCGWIDSVAVDYSAGLSWCVGDATCRVVLAGSRHDRPGTTRMLEAAVPPVVAALTAIDGVVVTTAETGIIQIGGEEVPATQINVQFALAE